MAKKAVIIEDNDFDHIIQDLLSAKYVLGSMRKTEKRERVLFLLDRVQRLLTDEDDIESRVRSLEIRVG